MKLLTYITVFFPIIALGQNLVLNNGFEDNTYCPPIVKVDSFPCKFWVASNYCTPDYYHDCSTDSAFSVPKNWNGVCFPSEGRAYVGLGVLTDRTGLMEHLTGSLASPLEKGRAYSISFRVCFAEKVSYYSAKNLGVYLSEINPFTNSMSISTYYNTLTCEHSAQVYYSNFLKDSGWVLIKGNYVAKGGERFVSIGLFWDNDPLLAQVSSDLNQYPLSRRLRRLFDNRLRRMLLKKNENFVSSTGNGNERLAYYLFDDIKIVCNE